MKIICLLFVLLQVQSIFSITRVYDIKVSLITPQKKEVISENPSALEISNVKTANPFDIRLKVPGNTLISHTSSKECKNCYFLVEFESKGQTPSKFYSSIDYDLVNNHKFEDFLEILKSETNDISSIKYGINKYLDASGMPSQTNIREWSLTDAPKIQRSFGVFEEIQSFSSSQSGEVKEPEKEKSFFQKYFWWIVIGGFILFQFLTIDKEKLNEAMNQAQNVQGGGRR